MSAVQFQLLTDRSLIRVGGPDAEKFLQGLITMDMDELKRRDRIFGALLSPQGKVQFDFYVMHAGDNIWIDVAQANAAAFVKRLSMYKLRSNVEIEDISAFHSIAFTRNRGGEFFKSMKTRAPDLFLFFVADPWTNGPIAGQDISRCYFVAPPQEVIKVLDALGNVAPIPDYDAYRISLGIPEGGKDYAFGEVFPHEAMFDQLNGVSFTKGCYVGQEIVARMQHRGTARSRFLMVTADAPLPQRATEVLAGETPIGAMGSSAKTKGLALVRLDRLADAYAAGKPVTTGGVPITLAKPPYATFAVPEPKI